MSGNNVLSLLGLALRGGRLAVGEEPAALAAKAGQARLLLTASDAAGNTLRRAEHLAEEGHCLHLTLPFDKAELGGALGRGSAAIAALTDLGLAAAAPRSGKPRPDGTRRSRNRPPRGRTAVLPGPAGRETASIPRGRGGSRRTGGPEGPGTAPGTGSGRTPEQAVLTAEGRDKGGGR